METITLSRTNETVAAKTTKYGLMAITYSNMTQANKKAAELGGEVIQRGRPFYVRLINKNQSE